LQIVGKKVDSSENCWKKPKNEKNVVQHFKKYCNILQNVNKKIVGEPTFLENVGTFLKIFGILSRKMLIKKMLVRKMLEHFVTNVARFRI
jgi:hypothetical protein